MHIYKLCVTPQGVNANYHRIASIVVNPADETVALVVNSYAAEFAALPCWQETHSMPMSEFSTGSYPANVYEWVVSNPGPLVGGALYDDPTSLEAKRSKTLRRINEMREAVVNGGCLTPSGVVDTNEISRNNVAAACQVALRASLTEAPYSVVWRLLDNSEVTVDAAGMLAIGDAVLFHVDRAYRLSWTLKAQVEAATSIEQIDNIPLVGWLND